MRGSGWDIWLLLNKDKTNRTTCTPPFLIPEDALTQYRSTTCIIPNFLFVGQSNHPQRRTVSSVPLHTKFSVSSYYLFVFFASSYWFGFVCHADLLFRPLPVSLYFASCLLRTWIPIPFPKVGFTLDCTVKGNNRPQCSAVTHLKLIIV